MTGWQLLAIASVLPFLVMAWAAFKMNHRACKPQEKEN